MIDAVAPAALALLGGVGVGLVHFRLRPAYAVWVLSAVLVTAVAAVVSALLLLLVGGFGSFEPFSELLGWCGRAIASHGEFPRLVGAGAAAFLAWGAVRTLRVARRWYGATRYAVASAPVEVLPTAQPIAHATPGRRGGVIVSAGMLDRLARPERQALFAHELSHRRHRHDRHIAIADLSSAAVPLLRPLADQLRFATERWADEDAAAAVGDRVVVARALTQAALAGSAAPPGSLSIAETDLSARLTALLDGGRRKGERSALAGLLLGVVAAGVMSTVQLHHLLAYAAHVCPLG